MAYRLSRLWIGKFHKISRKQKLHTDFVKVITSARVTIGHVMLNPSGDLPLTRNFTDTYRYRHLGTNQIQQEEMI